MTSRPGVVSRRFLAAILLSMALHSLLILNMKPVSARYASQPIRAQLRLVDPVSSDMPGAATLSAPPLDAPKPQGTIDSRLARSYVDAAEARPGNLPDGRSAPVEVALPLLSQYLTAREVDQRATALEDVPLVDAPTGLGPGKTGKLILLLLINENGGVDSVATLEAQPPGMIDGMARSAFATVRFSPALKDGKPVKSQKIVEILYGS
jgi:hypothetical protein